MPVEGRSLAALVDATWAIVGEDPLTKILGVLLPVLDRAVPRLAGEVIADALVGAFAHHYRCELAGDAELLRRIGHPAGDALEDPRRLRRRAARRTRTSRGYR